MVVDHRRFTANRAWPAHGRWIQLTRGCAALRARTLDSDLASRNAPRTREIVLLVNAADRTVKESAAEGLGRDWFRHGAHVSVFELPDSLRLPHNIIDAMHGRVGGDTVLALLRDLAYGVRPSGLVRRIVLP